MNKITNWFLHLTAEEAHKIFGLDEDGCRACPAAKMCEDDSKTCCETLRDWGLSEVPGETVSEASSDAVNHPAHYNTGRIEVIDAIDEWGLNFELGNVVKYVARAGHKADAQEDLKKAQWYLNHEIERRTTDGNAE